MPALVSVSNDSPSAMFSRETQVGNPNAAQDLYGLGVRVFFYLQALAMILYGEGDNGTGKGMKIAIGSITLSILASWFLFAARTMFSPCEAIIVLLLLLCLAFPAKATLLKPNTIVTETFGTIIIVVGQLSTCSALIWTFASLIDTLPTLQTQNVVFFFAKVSIHGWFRYFALLYCVIDAIASLFSAYKIAQVMEISLACYREGGRTETNFQENVMIADDYAFRLYIQILHWVVLILTVVAVELTLQWNRLSPSTDFQSPGQLIPFITGIIAFADSCLVVGRRSRNSFGFVAIVTSLIPLRCDSEEG